MTQVHDTARISRRKVLAGLGTIGVASAGAGFGSAAFFRDTERFPVEMTAGRLDLLVDFRATYSPWDYQPVDDDGTPYPVGDTMVDMGEEGPVYVVGMAPDLRTGDGTVVDNATWSAASLQLDACQPLADQFPLDIDGDGTDDVFRGDATRGGEVLENYSPDFVDGPAGTLFRLDDVKPRDRGETTISLHVCDNPAYLWLRTAAETDDENTRYEPELEAGETDAAAFADGELDDFLWVRAFYDPDCSNTLGEEEVVIYEGSLAGFLAYASDGLALDPVRDAGESDGTTDGGDQSTGGGADSQDAPEGVCYEPGTHCIAVEWYLPCEVEEDDGMGFAQLPSDAVETADPVNGDFPSLADELLATFDYADLDEIDVNVVQSDALTFALEFASVQCRHNAANPNPFDTGDSTEVTT